MFDRDVLVCVAIVETQKIRECRMMERRNERGSSHAGDEIKVVPFTPLGEDTGV